jgi:hypothetical protein
MKIAILTALLATLTMAPLSSLQRRTPRGTVGYRVVIRAATPKSQGMATTETMVATAAER